MAKTIKFEWLEIDDTIINYFKKEKKKQASVFGLDPTSVEDYRLKVAGGAIDNLEAPVAFSLTCDLNEDIDFDVSSEFDTPDDVLPGLGKLGRYSSLLSGSSAQILNIFQVPTWSKTNPLSLSIKPILYTRRNAVMDVLLPAWSLTSLTILKYEKKTGIFRTPGVWLGNVGASMNRSGLTKEITGQPPKEASQSGITINPGATAENQKAAQELKKGLEQFGKSSNFVKVTIPKILSFTGLLKSCKPTFSRQETESGGPLWAVLDMKIESAIPASSIELFSELEKIGDNNDDFTTAGSNNAVSRALKAASGAASTVFR